MSYRLRNDYSYNSPTFFPPGVRLLVYSNVAIFVIYFFATLTGFGRWFDMLGLIPRAVTGMFAIWQLFTYLFLHDPYGFGHILFNMLFLWMFGKDLEAVWGTRRFLQFYFICGIGAGICVVLANLFFGDMNSRTIGASGAIYGLLLAYGLTFPDNIILVALVFPMKAKYMVMIAGAIAFMSSIAATRDGVSHVAHLGGMIFGYLYLRSGYKRVDLLATAMERYREWKRARARRKFQVYMRKQDGRDRTIH